MSAARTRAAAAVETVIARIPGLARTRLTSGPLAAGTKL